MVEILGHCCLEPIVGQYCPLRSIPSIRRPSLPGPWVVFSGLRMVETTGRGFLQRITRTLKELSLWRLIPTMLALFMQALRICPGEHWMEVSPGHRFTAE